MWVFCICVELFTPDGGFFQNDLQMATAFFEICQKEIMGAQSCDGAVKHVCLCTDSFSSFASQKVGVERSQMDEQLVKKQVVCGGFFSPNPTGDLLKI